MSGKTVFLDFNIGVENPSSRGIFISVYDLCFKFTAFFICMQSWRPEEKQSMENH